MSISRFDVVLVELVPTRGSEMRKTRPCAVVSSDELNDALRTLVVAPMTTGGNPYPWHVPVSFGGKQGSIALDQVRTVDRERVLDRLGALDGPTATAVLERLAEIFVP